MVFAHDTEAALQGAAALVNTVGMEVDTLSDLAALDEFVREQGYTGSRRRSRAELDEVRALRATLRRLWGLAEDDLVNEVNQILRDAKALPQLVRHGEWNYHLHATPPDAPLADRMAVEAAMAFVDVIREGELSRLRICEYHDCESVVVDLSKNRSKRFCDLGCGNRAAVNAYRARRAARSGS